LEADAVKQLRIGIVGCGRRARAHASRLVHLAEADVVACADVHQEVAEQLAADLRSVREGSQTQVCTDLPELLKRTRPEAIAVFTPHRFHYPLVMEALQAGCHVFVEKPISTVPQEAEDISRMARSRNRVVGVGHQYRLYPSLLEARRRLELEEIGRIDLIVATLAQPWLNNHQGPADAWRLDPRVSGGGLLADAGDHLLDALIWLARDLPAEVAAFQKCHNPGLDVVTAAIVRLSGGALATLGLSALQPAETFELEFHGSKGHLVVSDRGLKIRLGQDEMRSIPLPEPKSSIDADFVRAALQETEPCCPAVDAVETVRLLEAIARSAATGQVIKRD
jgi:predicted dehydrogenase